MIFSSIEYIFLFLPLTVVGFILLGRSFGPRAAIVFLTAASIAFYGWWNPHYVPLLLASVLFNFGASRLMDKAEPQYRKHVLVIAIIVNLAALGYFKYANFFVDTLNAASGTDFRLSDIILPLGISFFTFTQIAYLVDYYRGGVDEYDPVHYTLFVSYFPHLIAGPILHHKDLMPQFARRDLFNPCGALVAEGLGRFSIGLFKKIVIADNLSPAVGAIYAAAGAGQPLSVMDSWFAAVGFGLQLYFDFSAYCDMAVGSALFFGIRLPENFNSPYKAQSIVAFWRQWHMTLSLWLRDYLYIPLGGNRKGPGRRYVNLFLTMLLGGIWHGAGFTFMIWGALHGAYLVINNVFIAATASSAGVQRFMMSRPGAFLSWLITFVAVCIAWVFFRADSVTTAMHILSHMSGFGELATTSKINPENFRILGAFGSPLAIMAVLVAAAALLPNSQQIMAGFAARMNRTGFVVVGGCAAAIVFVWAVVFLEGGANEFLYFDF